MFALKLNYYMFLLITVVIFVERSKFKSRYWSKRKVNVLIMFKVLYQIPKNLMTCQQMTFRKSLH